MKKQGTILTVSIDLVTEEKTGSSKVSYNDVMSQIVLDKIDSCLRTGCD
jgi:hypothetical protein